MPPELLETITIGPIPIFFCNSNTEMGLRAHCHQGQLSVEYRTLGSTGYPSFKTTNDALRARVREITGVEHPFRDATNETVLRRLWDHLDGWKAGEWEKWGGEYQLYGLHLDVLAADDLIGHDPGTTRYTVRRS